nr:MAG TPA: hypothetical protein [Caudoviricetes sp.]
MAKTKRLKKQTAGRLVLAVCCETNTGPTS